jgi:fructuronate reductase
VSVALQSRLRLERVAGLPAPIRPRVDPAGLRVGIVHLGAGAFHRAHQAVYTEDAIAHGGGDWGICAVAPRSPAVPGALAAQNGLYSVLTKGPDGHGLRVVGSIRECLHAPLQPDRLLARLVDPATRVVTLTVTEKGYRREPATGCLRNGEPDLEADLAGAWPPRTILGWVARGLDARRSADAGPVTILCCDNLQRNGPTLRGLVLEYCARLPTREGSRLAGWTADHVTFPATVVDRIVPATSSADLAEVAGRLGMSDLAAVVAEPFSQWVIEDDFAAGRPSWEAAGATLTRDARPYETAKLRLLNGAHSALAYLGAAAGYELVSDAVADPVLAAMLRRLMDDDVVPTLDPPAGFDLGSYKELLLGRFANRALGHRTTQIAMDGSQKLPYRLLDTARDRLAAGAVPNWVCLAVAGWMRYLSGPADDGRPLPVDDPLADRLRALAAVPDPARRADALLSVTEVFGTDLPADAAFRDRLVEHLECLLRQGVTSAVGAALAGR